MFASCLIVQDSDNAAPHKVIRMSFKTLQHFKIQNKRLLRMLYWNPWTPTKTLCAKYGTFQCQSLQIFMSHICLKHVAIIIRHHTYKSWCSKKSPRFSTSRLSARKSLHQFTPMQILGAKVIHPLHFSSSACRVEVEGCKSHLSSTTKNHRTFSVITLPTLHPPNRHCHWTTLDDLFQNCSIQLIQHCYRMLSNYQSVSRAMSLRLKGTFKCLCQ